MIAQLRERLRWPDPDGGHLQNHRCRQASKSELQLPVAHDTEIDGATSSTYTLQASDNGKVT